MKKLFRLLIFIFIITLIASFVLRTIEVRYKSEIDTYADEYGISRYLVYAVAKAESNFQSIAVSHKGAVGIMQLTPETAEWCASKMNGEVLAADMSVPSVNIAIGCYYLSYLLDRYNGSESAALAAYNAGASNVDEWLKNPACSSDGVTLFASPYGETDHYIKKVDFYKKLYSVLYRDLK